MCASLKTAAMLEEVRTSSTTEINFVGELGNQDSYAWLTQCGFAPADNTFLWACGLSVDCTDDNKFSVAFSNPTATDISGLVAVAPSSSGNDSATPTSSATGSQSSPANGSQSSDCPKQDTSNGVSPAVVGAGVGAPLAILLIIALATTLYYRRRWIRLRDSKDVSGSWYRSTPTGYGSGGYEAPLELAEKRLDPAQLDSNYANVFEIGDNRTSRRE